MEETTFLVTVQGIIGGVEIEDDAAQGPDVPIECEKGALTQRWFHLHLRFIAFAVGENDPCDLA